MLEDIIYLVQMNRNGVKKNRLVTYQIDIGI